MHPAGPGVLQRYQTGTGEARLGDDDLLAGRGALDRGRRACEAWRESAALTNLVKLNQFPSRSTRALERPAYFSITSSTWASLLGQNGPTQ